MTPDPEKRERAEDLAEDLRRSLFRAYGRISESGAALSALSASSKAFLSWADHDDPETPAYLQGVRAFGGADDLAPLVYAAMAGLLVQQEAAVAGRLWEQLEEVAAAEMEAI